MLELPVLVLSLAYLGVLFLVAGWGDRNRRSARRAPFVYTLGIGVYCTSWTFYGAVGEAAESGFDYLAIYVGPALVMLFGWPVLARMVRIARMENTVSISDFISARYGKSRGLAALVTLTAVIGLLPYFALQLKGITISFETLMGGGASPRLPGGSTFLIAVAMAAFAVLFGVRGLDASEPRRGLALAVALESLVKLVAALAVGVAVTAFAFDDPGRLLRTIAAEPDLRALASFDPARPVWWATCLLAGLAFLCLPRQFHMAVLENTDPRDVRAAAWGFPLYLAGISLFVLPVAAAGLLLFPEGGIEPDTFMVAIPREMGWPGLALFAFLGGLSAATGMIMVATVALGTMLSNDVIVPLLARSRRLRELENPAPALLATRRAAIAAIMALAYGFYQLIGLGIPLTEIGLISFAAVAQFAPALLGGLAWRRATAAGAVAGISAGFAGWLWTVLLPAVIAGGWLPETLAVSGPLGVAALSPTRLGGLTLDPLIHGMVWSLGPNILLYVAVSFLRAPTPAERRQAERFVALRFDDAPEEPPAADASVAELRTLAARFVGPDRAEAAFDGLGAARPLRPGDAALATERLLAGALGAASARVVVAGLASGRRLSRSDARGLIDDASRAIISRHELMRDTLENVPQGICAFDADFRVQLWNRRFVELIDQPPDRIQVGTPLEEIVAYNQARGEYGAQGEFDTLLARRLDPRLRDRADLYERRRPDGSVLEIATTPMPSGGFVAVYTDVTERQRAAAALRAANESLERRIAERTADLDAARAESERANRAKTRFLAGVGHDLLQPLQAARLFLSALSERVSDPAVGQVDAALHSVEHLLGQLLEVSKLDSGVTTAQVTDFRVAEVLTPLGEEFALLARRHDLAFTLAPCGAAVRSDRTHLRRILQNFLVNAVRYTPEGRILLGCRRRGDSLSIEVHDTGAGIAPDKLREIFAEFRQLEGTTAARGQGLGLGLSIVERLAGLLGHQIDVRSKPGRGSCFAVRVPIAARAAAPLRRPAAARHFAGALVLFVENDPVIAEAMRQLLEGWSCRTVTAATPEEGLARLGGLAPDLILTDYHLDAGRTGLDALRLLRARLGRTVPAAIVTADRDPGLAAAAAAAGARLVRKPIRPGALRALLTQLLAERAA